jgi:protein-tyrosine phosphatase
VTVFSGTGGWAWGWNVTKKKPVELVNDNARIAEKRLEAGTRLKKGMKKGGNRLKGAALDYALHTMGIRSDIDLRSDGECWGMEGSPLGKSVNWFHYSSAAYGGMQSAWGREAFAKVFRVFLDKKNYPIDFHCIAGQDRTGAVAFILNGLLGVEEEELFRDWESTGFWNGSPSFNHAKLFDNLYKGFEKWPGKTINERIEAYVLDLGFTKRDIDRFREIMLEKK